MRDWYSKPPCTKCSNYICKMYGGTCRKYRIVNFFKKVLRGNRYD